MSLTCGVECVLCLGVSRWIWKRCTYVGSDDSATWPLSTPEDFEPIPRICRAILAVYEDDLRNPKFGPDCGYGINPDWVIKRVTYEQNNGRAPPYLIYVDHTNQEIILAIRGLNLVSQSDYKLLLDNRLGMQMFDGGYVHHGLLKSAIWLLNQESDTLKRLWLDNGSRYKMIFAGHSLGSGVAALLTIVVVNHRNRLGGIPRSDVKCYAIAPARCMSLNLAVKYADVINSVILQDDFLPRTPTPLEDVFKSIFWFGILQFCFHLYFICCLLLIMSSLFIFLVHLKNVGRKPAISFSAFKRVFLKPGLNALDSLPCLLFFVCMRDTFIPEGRKLRDPRRLYAPGRMYHIVERKFCRCGRYPPEVRTAIPVEERFEHIVLSSNATSDHAIIWIEREARKALERMKESSEEVITTAPMVQKLERLQTLEKEHKDALEKAVSLNVPHAVTELEQPPPPDITSEEEASVASADQDTQTEDKKPESKSRRTNWSDIVENLFNKSDSGELALKEDIKIQQ